MNAVLASTLGAMMAAAPSDAAAMTGAVIPIFIVSIVFTTTAAIVAIVLYASYRTKRLRYETLRFAIEKGGAVPQDLLLEGRPRQPEPVRDLRRGLVLLFLGAGLCLFLGILDGTAHNGVWSVGFVPALLGIGFLITWALTRPARGAAPSGPVEHP